MFWTAFSPGGRDLRDGSSERRAEAQRHRSVPSAVFRYLEMFHDADEEARREAHRAFIPSPNEALSGLYKVNADLMGFVQGRSPQREATLDMDARPGRRTSRRLSTAQEVQGVPAADDLLVRGRPDRPFGVPRRQRTCGLPAAAGVDRSAGASACRCGESDVEV